MNSAISTRYLVITVLISASIATLVALGRPTLAQLVSSEDPVPPTSGPGEGISMPVISAEQIDRVKSVALADTRVQALTVAGQVGAQPEVVAWTDGAGRIIGGVASLPYVSDDDVIESEWLAVRWMGTQPDVEDSYQSYRYRAKFSSVEEIRVFVDLSKNAVVGLSPGKPAELVGEVDEIDPLPPPPTRD